MLILPPPVVPKIADKKRLILRQIKIPILVEFKKILIKIIFNDYIIALIGVI